MTSRKEREYWDRHAKNYDRSMVLLGGPIPRMVELAAEAVHGAARVLEVAAGKLEERVRERGLANVRCEQADLYTLRFDPGSFDAVVAANVLHPVPDLPGALEALRKVLRPGCRLVAPTYCHDETALAWVFSRALAITGFPGHRRFTAQSLRESLESAGFEVMRAETLPGLIPIHYVEGTFP